ncbi:TM2 domain-containing protein [Acinetobacter sp. B5B]|uniref:TM2 domain-containing protein n=1 Tax=Acinetobacter baretiae TaxID=2605383 RepID=UPI0018C31331|nr:TM2 domain-containing protein [Acinetobacter baretiae]MBF7683521.1 TM2 domain-containing protein [Acinetobacter baretiae]
MSFEREILIEQKVADRRKSKGIAYLLFFMLGGVGGHRFYLDSPLTAIALIFLSLLAFKFEILVIVLALWFLCDLFLIPSMTDKYNSKVLRDARLEALRLTKNTNTEQ